MPFFCIKRDGRTLQLPKSKKDEMKRMGYLKKDECRVKYECPEYNNI